AGARSDSAARAGGGAVAGAGPRAAPSRARGGALLLRELVDIARTSSRRWAASIGGERTFFPLRISVSGALRLRRKSQMDAAMGPRFRGTHADIEQFAMRGHSPSRRGGQFP